MSAFLELHPELERNSLDTAMRPGATTGELPDPGIFSGRLIGSLGRGALTGAVKLGSTTEAYFSDAWGRGLNVASTFLPSPQGGGAVDVTSSERAANEMNVAGTARAINDLRPNPYQDGAAAQVLHSLGDVLTRATLGSTLAGPVGGAGAVGLSEEFSSRAVSAAEGIDPVTAQKKAAVDAITTGAGILIPGSNVVTSKAADALLTIGGNVLLGVGGRAANRQILDSAGYAKQAEQHDPFDPTAVATDVVLGGSFWGLSRFMNHRAEAQLKPSESDAIRTRLNAQHYAEASAPGKPADTTSENIHAANMEESIAALAEGRTPRLHPETAASQFVPRPADAAARELVRSQLPVEHRFGPSAKLEGVQPEQRKALRFDAPELNEYAALVEQRYGLPGGLINALKNAGEKSNSTQVSPAGAAGVMQFMPENLKKYGVTDSTDPVQMIDAAGRYVRDTLKQYGGNVDAVIADYNGGPRQARRVLNGELPKAEETRAYLDRVRTYLNRQDQPYVGKQPTVEEFAAKTGRRYAVDAESRPVFEDGTAFPREAISDFYDQHVANLPKGDKSPMPDVLFRIGEVDDFTAAGLREFLPGFTDDLREARISAQSIKHIQDSRPAIAREVLQRLDDGTLYADEVLPNPKDMTRAFVVLKDAGPTGESIPKHLSQVLEVSANGKGIDVVTAMTARDGALNKARELKRQIIEQRGETARDGGAAYPSSSLADSLANQPHAAADFPTFAQNRDPSIATTDATAKAAKPNPLGNAADDVAATNPELLVASGLKDAQGNDIATTAKALIDEARTQAANAEADSKGFIAAVTCFLSKG